MDKLRQDMEFIVELDKLKTVLRRTSLIGVDQREDDAQHSWHISVMAMVLEEYADREIDVNKVIQMLLIHDIVEIYAGDTFAYDKEGYKDKEEREKKAAREIYGLLSANKGERFIELWEEFEYFKSDEAYFAAAMDRLQPILNNINDQGGTWAKYDVSRADVLERLRPIEDISRSLYDYALGIVEEGVEQGYLQ